MDVELRPLSLGEILDRVFQLYRRYFLLFTGIASFPAGINLVWKLIQTLAVKSLGTHVPVATLGVVNAGFGFLNVAVAVIVGAVAMAATNRAISSIYLGRPTGIAQAYREIKDRWLRFVGLYVMVIVVAWGPVFLLLIGIFTALLLTAKKSPGMVFIVTGIFGLSMLVLVPFGIWMSLRYALSNPACVFEDLTIRASLKRSIFLSHGAEEKAKIFVVIFVAGVISTILAYAGLAPLMVISFRAVMGHTQPVISIGMTIYTLIVGFVISCVSIPLYAIGLTLLYYDARIRKEGFDVQWMIERAGASELPGSISGTPTLG